MMEYVMSRFSLAFMGYIKVFAFWTLCFIFILMAIWPYVLVFLFIYHACETTTLTIIDNLSGLDFDITAIECDTLAKTASINIFVAHGGTNDQTLIFKFDPVDDSRYVLPTITVSNKDIVISIERIGSIYSPQEKWHDYQIKYMIDYNFADDKRYQPEP